MLKRRKLLQNVNDLRREMFTIYLLFHIQIILRWDNLLTGKDQSLSDESKKKEQIQNRLELHEPIVQEHRVATETRLRDLHFNMSI
jgi:hypothetical protein